MLQPSPMCRQALSCINQPCLMQIHNLTALQALVILRLQLYSQTAQLHQAVSRSTGGTFA